MDASLTPLIEAHSAAEQEAFARHGAAKRELDSALALVAATASALGVAAGALDASGRAQTAVYAAALKVREAADKLVAPAAPPVEPPVTPPTPPAEPPVTPPVTPPTNPPADPNAIPTAPLAGWKQVLAEDFATPAAAGAIETVYGPKGWKFYSNFTDTSKRGTYDTKNITVKDGVMRIRVGTINGKPTVAAPSPYGYTGMLHGRYAVRFRADRVDGYKIAWLLWPKSDKWVEGEVDFPEADLTGPIKGYSHEVNGNPANNAASCSTSITMTDWHTAVIEWKPGSLEFLLDGKSVMRTTNPKAIPKTPMRWTLQTETELNSTPINPAAAGDIEIAWVTVHSYAT